MITVCTRCIIIRVYVYVSIYIYIPRRAPYIAKLSSCNSFSEWHANDHSIPWAFLKRHTSPGGPMKV